MDKEKELEKKILWSATTDINAIAFYGKHTTNRKEFNKKIRENLGEDAYKIAVRLWKEGYINLGGLGTTRLSGKGIMRMLALQRESGELTEVKE